MLLLEFGEYVVSILDKWFFWVGVVLLIPEFLKRVPWWKDASWKKELPVRLFWSLAVVCFVIASFQAWHEERLKIKEGALYLRPAMIAPRSDPGSLDIFPIGEPLSVNVAWTVFGPKPAMNAFQYGLAYLESSTDPATQQQMMRDFQVKWRKTVEDERRKEHAPVYPGANEGLGSTFQGPTLSETDKLDIKFSRKLVFIIGAAQFDDELGTHEAHICRWLQLTTKGDLSGLAWHECEQWVTQIDIQK